MDSPVFYIENVLSESVITLDEETSKHAVQVLRMKPLEKLQLTNGAGKLLIAEIVDDHKRKCTVRVIERQEISKKKQEVCIGMSLLKNNSRFEWFLEKATEIGVTEFIPLLCERTEKQHFKFERMKQILISAMMQSKQVWLPVIHQPVDVLKVISSSGNTTKLIAHCDNGIKTPLSDFSGNLDTKILIGPEGDFSSSEIDAALENAYCPVSLGPTRLRTETAGIVAATLLCIN